MSELPPGVPTNAEHHLRSNFATERPGKPSLLAPGKRQASTEEFFCPSCGIANKPPDHGVHAHCQRCELQWIAYGNSLYIWKSGTKLRVV